MANSEWIMDDDQDGIIPRMPQPPSLQDEIKHELHEGEAVVNPTLIVPVPDPRDPSFEPRLEERAQRIIAAGLMRWDVNPCVKHLEIIRAAFLEFTPEQYPWLVLQIWWATKDWKRKKQEEFGLSTATKLSEFIQFDTAQFGETYKTISRLQMSAVKLINTNKIDVPPDPRFDNREEIYARIL